MRREGGILPGWWFSATKWRAHRLMMSGMTCARGLDVINKGSSSPWGEEC